MRKKVIFDLIIILILGFLPVLWLKDGTVILGHDAGLPLDPLTHFLDRLYVWSQRFGIGTDQSPALLGAFLIHGIEAFLSWVGFNLQYQQIIQFVFWFILIGLAMYFFASRIFPEKKYLPLFASVIYMLNFYLLQGWFVAERTKFSIYVALPLVLYLLIRYFEGKRGLISTIVLTGVVLGIFNGGGSLPLYGGLAFAVLIVFVYVNLISLSIKTFKKTIFYTIGVGVIYALLNAYWLIPYVFYLSGFAARDLAQAGGPEGALTWARYLSSQSTFINLFRGQGIPDWYLNPYHAYSGSFLHNPVLVGISFLLPILAFASIRFIKSKKDSFYLYLLILICIVGILFSAGPESQLGFIYELMVKYIPGFAMFRSAFHKFNYMVWFSYSILIGYTLNYILSRIETSYFSKKLAFAFSTMASLILVAGYIYYHYPVLDGSFLDYTREPGKELTTRVKPPTYVFEFGKWVNSQNPNTRFLVMPQLSDTGYISYDWKYWSLAPVTSLLTRNSFVHNTALVPESERVLMKEMYAAFLRNDMESFLDFTDVFAIDQIVLQKDYDWKKPTWGTVNPLEYEKVLKSNPKLFVLDKSFGKWDIFKISEQRKSLRINSSTRLSFLEGKLGKVVSFPYFDPKSPLFMSNIEKFNIDYYVQHASDIYLAPECIQCDLEYKEKTFQYYNPKILPGSIFYPLVTFREEQVKASANDFTSLINFYIATANRRIVEIKWMVDSRQRIEQILPNIERYRNTLRQLSKELERKESALIENRVAQMAVYNILEQVNLIDSIYNESIVSILQRQALAESYDDILKVEKIARKKMWVTEDMTNKKYIYDLPITGDYEIYVKKGSLTNPENDLKDTAITFRDLPQELKPLKAVGDWLSFGKIDLKNTKTFITLKDGTLSNMIESVSPVFPDGKEGIIQNKNSFTFTTNSLNKCFYYQFSNLEYLNTQYVVSFTYRNFSDKNNLNFYNQSEGDKLPKYSIKNSTLPIYRYPSRFVKLITPPNGNVRLNFCNGFLSLSELTTFEKDFDRSLLPDREILTEVRDVTFHKVAYPNIALYKKQKDSGDFNSVINFSKVNPVTYSVELAESSRPLSLIMRENYGKYWRVCDDGGNCLPYDDKSHFTTGGFANAWYLKDTNLGKKLTLYYYPQRWYVLGSIITIFSVGVFILLLCIRLLRKK